MDVMRPIAQKHQVSVAQVSLAWLLSKSYVTSVIIGAKTLVQLEDNIASTKLKLSETELKALEDVSQLPVEYPGWMLAFQGQYRAKAPVKE